MTDPVTVQADPFDVGAEIAALTARRTDIGAVVSFTGLVRDVNEGRGLSALTLEHYPGMTERELGRIVAQAQTRWPLQAVRVIHRYGRMEPGEGIVLVIAASAHRQAAFEAASFLMDYLKTQAPFWKVEDTADGPQWVDARRSDDAARTRWEE